MNEQNKYQHLLSQNEDLRSQLAEAQDAIQAIRTGKIDALIVQGDNGQELYTLKSADHTYRMFIEKMSEGAVTLHSDGAILYCNNRFAAMVNTSLEKVIGKPFSEFIHAATSNKYEQLLQSGWEEDIKTELNLAGARDTILPCLISCNRLHLEEGSALSLIVTDLSSQKTAEEELRKKNQSLEQAEMATRMLNDRLEELVQARTRELYLSREQFKFLADQIPVLVWSANTRGDLDYFNNRWFEYTGLSFNESKGSGWEKAVHPDDLKMAHHIWANSVKTGEPYEIEYRLKRSDNSFVWHLGYGLPFKDETGKILAWFCTGTDIEEQKLAIEKRDEFIGIASHELKTPLTTVKAYLEIISRYEKEPLPVPVTQYINKAQGAMRKLHNLVSDLLDVSKINAGQFLYDKQVFNLTELVLTCVENFNHLYPHRKLLCICNEKLIVNGNSARIEQVIMNLISNAVKYSPAHTDISIHASRKGNNAVVSLTDHGIGLSPEQKERIFERFYRVEDKKFLTSGLGMGLYISSEIVKSHGGALTVSSEFGQGSVFSLEIPLVKQKEPVKALVN